MARDINKEQLYEAVKTLIESKEHHISLPQQKLFTIFSIAFNYMLYASTKKPGHYIIRVEDSHLAEKLARKSKDTNTRKFLGQMLVPRRLKYNKSMFHLDYFLPTTWGKTCELPKEKIQGAIVIKNTALAPMQAMLVDEAETQTELSIDGTQQEKAVTEIAPTSYNMGLEENFYLTSLRDFVPRTIAIAMEESLENYFEIKFPFIKSEHEECVRGVKIATGIELDNKIN